jgi:alpha-N-acetylglucosamine transferase
MNHHEELLFELIENWTDEQLETYITMHEERLENTRILIRKLKELMRRRTKRKIVETGTRGGK